MVTNKRFLSIQQFVTQNYIRLGIVGFLIGACLSVSCVGIYYFSIAFYNYQDAASSYSSLEYSERIDEYHHVVYIDPVAAISRFEPATEYNPNEIDQIKGLFLIAGTYTWIGDQYHARQIHERILDSTLARIESNVPQSDLGFIYSSAVSAANYLGESELSDRLYYEMLNRVPLLLNDFTNAQDLADALWYIFSSANDKYDYSTMGTVYAEMRDRLEPLVGDQLTVTEIGTIYQHLTTAAQLMGDVYQAEKYQQELIDVLTPRLEGLTDQNEIVLVSKYMGAAEAYLGKGQFSAVHYRTIVTYKPTAFNIYRLAITYSQGGNLECAYKWFQRLLDLDDEQADIYQAIAEEQIVFFDELDLDCDKSTCCP